MILQSISLLLCIVSLDEKRYFEYLTFFPFRSALALPIGSVCEKVENSERFIQVEILENDEFMNVG